MQEKPPPASFPAQKPVYSGKANITYLALGDSYTIGQSIPAPENYPNQAVTLLKKRNLATQLKIIATSGWTTDQLKTAIINARTEGSLTGDYDFVSLLIGVNNQYQGRGAADYGLAFEELLKEAIQLSGNMAAHVIVLSIPDWSVTPFAAGKNEARISAEIEAYNVVNKKIANDYGVNYIDITPATREAASDGSLLSEDGLHYSGKAYALWAQAVAGVIKTALQ